MNTKLEKLKTKQAEIETFFEKAKTKVIMGPELRKWIVDSVTHFAEIGINENLIDLFLNSCAYRKDKEGKRSHGVFEFRLLKKGYVLEDYGRSKDISPFIVPIHVALSVSRMLVDKYEEEERIIPKSLTNIFQTEKHHSIKLALESIESNYQTKDPRGMMGPLVTATELICKLIPEIADEINVNACLRRLYEEKALRDKYRINKDVVWSLNSARIIRNEEVIHAKPEHEGNISIYEAVGYTHLLVLFADSLLASGQCTFD